MTTQSHAITSENHAYINQLSKHVGAEVVLKGRLYNMRSSGKILFPQLRDGTGVVQCTAWMCGINTFEKRSRFRVCFIALDLRFETAGGHGGPPLQSILGGPFLNTVK